MVCGLWWVPNRMPATLWLSGREMEGEAERRKLGSQWTVPAVLMARVAVDDGGWCGLLPVEMG